MCRKNLAVCAGFVEFVESLCVLGIWGYGDSIVCLCPLSFWYRSFSSTGVGVLWRWNVAFPISASIQLFLCQGSCVVTCNLLSRVPGFAI